MRASTGCAIAVFSGVEGVQPQSEEVAAGHDALRGAPPCVHQQDGLHVVWISIACLRKCGSADRATRSRAHSHRQ